jgi:hypothetical protein
LSGAIRSKKSPPGDAILHSDFGESGDRLTFAALVFVRR